MKRDDERARDASGSDVSPFEQAPEKSGLERAIPVSKQLPGYKARTARRCRLARGKTR